MGLLNRFLKVKNCSWCHKSYLWGRLPCPFHLLWINKSHGICPTCSRILSQQLERHQQTP